MLQVKNIVKTYVTGELKQDALKGVSINFRENEFVSILGQSGSGKTTLLNIIGGLDRYTSGDLIINGVSTKQYKDADWDIYRNTSIGFVFQSYNLIPPSNRSRQCGISADTGGGYPKERRQRGDSCSEKSRVGRPYAKSRTRCPAVRCSVWRLPARLSIIPEILLADKPTGALDSETSLQIMELLGEIAKDKLVIMVTHNPDLAERYSTRIVKLLDSKIVSDSHPYRDTDALSVSAPRKKKKISMSFLRLCPSALIIFGQKKAVRC